MSDKLSPELLLQEIRSKLEEFSGIVQSYKENLKAELQTAEDDPEVFDSYLWSLNRQITNLEALEILLENETMPLLKSMGGVIDNQQSNELA